MIHPSLSPTQNAFIAAFRACANISKSADAVRIDRCLHYRWLRDDPEYAAAFQQAVTEASQFLEDQAVERATEGWQEPVIYQGQLALEPVLNAEGNQIYVPAVTAEGDPILLENGDQRMDRLMKPLTIRKRSDALLQTLLKAWIPRKYGDKTKIELGGLDGAPIALKNETLAKLTDEQLSQLTELAGILAQPGRVASGEAPEGSE